MISYCQNGLVSINYDFNKNMLIQKSLSGISKPISFS